MDTKALGVISRGFFITFYRYMKIIRATVEKIEDFQKGDMKEALRLMGFDYLEMNFYRRIDLDGDLVFYAERYDDAKKAASDQEFFDELLAEYKDSKIVR